MHAYKPVTHNLEKSMKIILSPIDSMVSSLLKDKQRTSKAGWEFKGGFYFLQLLT